MKKIETQHPVLAGLNFTFGLTVLILFWFIIPLKNGLITLIFSAIGLTLCGSGTGLLLNRNWGPLLARAVSWTIICFGLILSFLALTGAAYLSGVYGTMGKSAAGIYLMLLVIFNLLLVLLPGLQLYHLRKRTV